MFLRPGRSVISPIAVTVAPTMDATRRHPLRDRRRRPPL